MTDLEILAKFRQAQADGTLFKLTKFTHTCVNLSCDTCLARQACRTITSSDINNDFETNYRRWAKRTTFHDLPYLQQHYPEHLI